MKIYWLIKIFVLLSGLLMSFGSQAAIGDATVQAALKEFYSSTGGPSWTTSTGWTAATISCTAHGITCVNNNVEIIELINNNLAGPIPSSFGQLTNLVRLKLQNNSLTGAIPATMGNFTNLAELLLYNNQLEGPIPAEIGNLTILSSFQVNNNRLSGVIPTELENLLYMGYFYLDANQFVGELPPELINLGRERLLNSGPLYIDLNWNAAFSSDPALNTFINQHPTGTYELSQTTPPTGVERRSKTTSSIELGWNEFQTSPPKPGGYKILQATSEFGSYSQVGTNITDRLVTSITINGLTEGVNYWYKICSYTDTHAENPKNIVISKDSIAVTKGVPFVDAGLDMTADEVTSVTLTASANDDSDGGSISGYSWTQSSGPAVDLSGIDTSSASLAFTTPKYSADSNILVFRVTVTDDLGDISFDDVQVTINDAIIPPVVDDPTTDQPGDEVEEESWIEMIANAYDLDGEVVKYYWEQIDINGVVVDLETIDSPRTRFRAPNVNGNRSIRLGFKVTVTDNDGLTDTSDIYVVITKKNVIVTGGGALGWPWLLLLGMPLLGRRFLK